MRWSFVGICEKICVPFQAEFEIDLPEGTDTDDAARASIREAFDRLPEPAGADFNVERAVLDADGGQLEISARLPQFRPSGATPEVFVAAPPGFAFAQPVPVADENGAMRWSVDIASVPATAAPEQSETLDIVVTLGAAGDFPERFRRGLFREVNRPGLFEKFPRNCCWSH